MEEEESGWEERKEEQDKKGGEEEEEKKEERMAGEEARGGGGGEGRRKDGGGGSGGEEEEEEEDEAAQTTSPVNIHCLEQCGNYTTSSYHFSYRFSPLSRSIQHFAIIIFILISLFHFSYSRLILSLSVYLLDSSEKTKKYESEAYRK